MPFTFLERAAPLLIVGNLCSAALGAAVNPWPVPAIASAAVSLGFAGAVWLVAYTPALTAPLLPLETRWAVLRLWRTRLWFWRAWLREGRLGERVALTRYTEALFEALRVMWDIQAGPQEDGSFLVAFAPSRTAVRLLVRRLCVHVPARLRDEAADRVAAMVSSELRSRGATLEGEQVKIVLRARVELAAN